jgi:hypothetical protein
MGRAKSTGLAPLAMIVAVVLVMIVMKVIAVVFVMIVVVFPVARSLYPSAVVPAVPVMMLPAEAAAWANTLAPRRACRPSRISLRPSPG